MKKTTAIPLSAFLFVASAAAQAADPQVQAPAQPAAAPARAEDEKAIRATFDTFAQAYQKGDAKALTDLFTPEAEVADSAGGTLHGHDALSQHYTSEFTGGSGDQIKNTVESITFLDPSLARSTGRAEITPAGEKAPHVARFQGIHLRLKGAGSWPASASSPRPNSLRTNTSSSWSGS